MKENSEIMAVNGTARPFNTSQSPLRLFLPVKIKYIFPWKSEQKPFYQTPGAAGMDLRAVGTVHILPGCILTVPTGIALAIPEGFEAQVRSRSGLAAKNGIAVLNSPGTIDSDYRGEIKVILINQGKETFVINHGDRIAQIVFAQVTNAVWKEVEDLDETQRGAGGLGSTGKE